MDQNQPFLDALLQRIQSVEWAITAVGVWATIAAVVLALVTIGLSTIGVLAFQEFRKASRVARKSKEEAVAALEAFELRSNQKIADIERSNLLLEEKFSKLADHSKDFIAAEVYYRNSDFRAALHHYRRAQDLIPDSKVLYRIARCKTYLGEQDQALQILERLKEGDPSNPALLRGIAFAHRFRRPDEAISALKAAKDLPSSTVAEPELKFKIFNDLGLLYRDIDRFADCEHWHRMALDQRPNDGVTLYFVSVAAGLNGKITEFRDLLAVAHKSAIEEAAQSSIKPLWLDVIKWSALAADRQEKQCREIWIGIQREFQADYVRRTVQSNIDKVAVLTGVNLARYAPS